ncbi:MAG TPA: hypothetical protein VKX46_05785 [Ktedonobacteraceae bacterium]|jgi:hypothetical protein|nr:hypothetical protein [Ktedonobacteraceae bacterium]
MRRRIQLIQCSGNALRWARGMSKLAQVVLARYPGAWFHLGEQPTEAVVVVPDLVWNRETEVFFSGLCRSGYIEEFVHRSYSDWPEGVTR